MDGLSAIAGVATAGVQLSKSLYDLYTTVKASRPEIEDVANNVSLLAMVLEELNGVLCDDELSFKPSLQEAAQKIALRCRTIFEDIHKHTGADRDLKGKKFYEKLAWYFKRERVRPLRSSLESLKSTLNILLHVVQLAKSTKGIEEYPGVKPIGDWYVRKERRGLVCLVIENRHAVEKLKHLEEQTSHTDLDKIEHELPLAFADIFPLPTPNHKRGQSPERKFVVAFGKRRNDDSRRSEEPNIHITQTGPSTPNGHRLLLPSSSREVRSHQDVFMHSDAESIGQSTLFQSNRNSRARTRPIKEQAISRLILDIVPHEEAERLFQSAQNMSRSDLLEVRAEETIDMLMRKWTFVDPKYFSEDDRSSIASSEPSFPIRWDKTPQRTDGKKILEPTEGPDIQYNASKRRTSEILENSGLRKERDGSQSVSPKEASSFLPAVRSRKEKKRPSPLIPICKNLEDGRGAKDKTSSSTPSDQGLQTAKEPSTPAPPYPSSPRDQCPSCHAGSSSAPTPYAGTRPDQPMDAKARDRKETSSSIDSALRLFENKNLEMWEKLHSHQLHKATEQQDHHHQAHIIEQEADPVILKDCLGRKFLFPLEKCRSWQSMENLIKSSFSHVESLNSKVFRGNYDILSPTGEIILPEVWEAAIRPGWVVELRLWELTRVGETGQKAFGIAVMVNSPAIPDSPTSSKKSHMEVSPGVQLVTAKRRASLRTWLGSRKSTPSIAVE